MAAVGRGGVVGGALADGGTESAFFAHEASTSLTLVVHPFLANHLRACLTTPMSPSWVPQLRGMAELNMDQARASDMAANSEST